MATNFSSLHVFDQLWAVPCAVELLKKNKNKANKLVGVHEKGIIVSKLGISLCISTYMQFFSTIALPFFLRYFSIHLLAYSVSRAFVCFFVILSCYEYSFCTSPKILLNAWGVRELFSRQILL